jgi:hypothetical protein
MQQEEAGEELLKEENIDDAEFDKYQEGELDLPEDSDFGDSESDEEIEEDSDLDDYYRELGISPEEMKTKD